MFLGIEAYLIPSYAAQPWLYFERTISFLLYLIHCSSVTDLLRGAPVSGEMSGVLFYLSSQQFL